MVKKKEKNILLLVGVAGSAVIRDVAELKRIHKKKYRFALLHPSNKRMKNEIEARKVFDVVIKCNLNAPKQIIEKLLPYKDEFCAVTCRSESNIPYFQKIIPYVPYLRTPSTESLDWSINKIKMRRRFSAYDKSMTPTYRIVHNTKKESLDKAAEVVGFPMIVKPSGLAASLLVSIAFHREELETVIKGIFKKVKKLDKDFKLDQKDDEPRVLVEQFMEGDMYTIDAYINSRGKVYFCPLVEVKTGRTVGFDDFFGYLRITPTQLDKSAQVGAEKVTRKALHALGLRSSTAHVELMLTKRGWKIIEVGPRMGGFRNTMYKLSYDIDHTANDFYIRIPQKPIIPKKAKGYTAVMQFFAKKEGKITKLSGVKRAEKLKSYKKISVHKKIGDRATFAKHGGKSVFDIILFAETRSQLLGDIRRLEQMVNIETL